jgi:hypothetical protein
MASSPSPSRTRRKKSDHQPGNNLLSIHNSKICYDGKKPALNDEDKEQIAAFKSALKEINVTEDMSEPEQTSLIKKYCGVVKAPVPTVALFVRLASRAKRDFNRYTIAEQSGLSDNIRFTVTTRRSLRFSRRVWTDTTINLMAILL